MDVRVTDVALAVFTGLLVWYGRKQADRLRESVDEMKNATTATKTAAAEQAVLTRDALAESQKGTAAATSAAKAAERSATVAETALTHLERPYVFVVVPTQDLFEGDLPNGQPLTLKPGASFSFRLKNYGRTPAILKEIKVSVQVVEYAKQPSDFIEPINAVFDSAIAANGETEEIRFLLPYSLRDDAKKLWYGMTMKHFLFVIVNVRYGEIFREEEHITDESYFFDIHSGLFVGGDRSLARRPNKRT